MGEFANKMPVNAVGTEERGHGKDAGYKTRSKRRRTSQELTHHLAVSILYTPEGGVTLNNSTCMSGALFFLFQPEVFPPQSPEGARNQSACRDTSRRQKALTRTPGKSGLKTSADALESTQDHKHHRVVLLAD